MVTVVRRGSIALAETLLTCSAPIAETGGNLRIELVFGRRGTASILVTRLQRSGGNLNRRAICIRPSALNRVSGQKQARIRKFPPVSAMERKRLSSVSQARLNHANNCHHHHGSNWWKKPLRRHHLFDWAGGLV